MIPELKKVAVIEYYENDARVIVIKGNYVERSLAAGFRRASELGYTHAEGPACWWKGIRRIPKIYRKRIK